MGGGLSPRGGKKRKTRPDIARRSESQRDWEVAIAHGSVEFCEAAPIGLADESKESLDGRETDRDHLRNADLRRNPRLLED